MPPDEPTFQKLMTPDYPGKTSRSLCDMALLNLLASTGCRVSEICNLTRANLDLEKRMATVTLKGGATGVVYLHREPAEIVKEWLNKGRPQCEKEASPDAVLLTEKGKKLDASAASRRIQEHCRRRGITKVTAHTLRHRFATKLLERGATLMEVQALMNHKSLSSTLVYLHTTETQARAAHARLSNETPKEKGKK
jgi:site-specific recombinase XerD